MDPMTVRLPAGTDDERQETISTVAGHLARGRLVVLPTDTVYGVAADAFDTDAVARLLAAKGRGRELPPPVLVSAATTLDALATDVPDHAKALVDRFWPGALTLVCRQQPSLTWDLGETRGTVAVRMPDHDLAREILERTGPLAVSSANTTGQPPATTADEAEEMLGDKVAAVVDGGPTLGVSASTIVDVTGKRPRVLRQGVITTEELDEALEPFDLTVLVVDDKG